jgi:hypothetical protein
MTNNDNFENGFGVVGCTSLCDGIAAFERGGGFVVMMLLMILLPLPSVLDSLVLVGFERRYRFCCGGAGLWRAKSEPDDRLSL